MLCSHSRLYIPPETDFIPYFFRKDPQEQLSEERITHILKIIFSRYRFTGEWQGSPPSSEQILREMQDRTPASFLNALYTLYAAQNGKVRWGDKTPIYASYLDFIHQIFPEAKFIHILRDPFDAGISLLEKYQKEEFHIDIYFAARNWMRRINDINQSREHLPTHLYHELRYEDLVQQPEEKIQEVCDFLGEDYEPSMLHQHLLAQNKIAPDSRFFANVRKPVNTDSIGRGRRELSLSDRRLMQKVCAPLMGQYGYAQDELGIMPANEKIRMAMLRSKYEILQAGRRTATSLGLMPPI
jgi:hypothetical protein